MFEPVSGNIKLAFILGFNLGVTPNPRRLKPGVIDAELYKKGNAIERLFRRLKSLRRIFTRYNKLDAIFMAFITFALIIVVIKYANTT